MYYMIILEKLPNLKYPLLPRLHAFFTASKRLVYSVFTPFLLRTQGSNGRLQLD